MGVVDWGVFVGDVEAVRVGEVEGRLGATDFDAPDLQTIIKIRKIKKEIFLYTDNNEIIIFQP